VKFRILGPLEVASADGIVEVGGAKRRALLALLLVHANQVVARDRLIDDLWAGSSRESATGTLQTYLSQLRKALQLESLRTRPGGYVLEVAPGELDALRFEFAVQEVSGAQDAAPSWVASQLGEALAWWRGPALADFEGESWAQPEAARLEELRVAAVERLTDARLALGEHVALVPELEVLVAKHPLREGLWAQLMLALYRSDRQADALRTYGRLRRHLGEELGIEPSKELVRLEEAILLQRAELDWEASQQESRPATEMLPSGVVTFLLSDIVGSTALWEENPKTMADAVARHGVLMQGAVAAHGGTVLKARGEGDSTFSVFTRATDAVDAALSAQRALVSEAWPESTPLSVRISLHTGEAFERDGDYYGPAVNRAARIRSLAAGSQILLSQSTSELVRDDLPEHATLVELGSHVLSDLARAEQISGLAAPGLPEYATLEAETLESSAGVSVPVPGVLRDAGGEPWERAPEAGQLPFPPLLESRQALAFSGREGELATVLHAWNEASGGSRRCVVVSGEPGIGKTRLVAEAARVARGDGAVVLYGCCDDALGVPFQPFAEALDWYVARADEVVLGRWPGDLARVAPQLRARVRNLPRPLDADPDSEQYRLFDAVASWLTAVSAEHPVVVVLDDLHWATKPTLLMLRHVVRTTGPARLLLVLTYRDTDISAEHPLAATLAALHREPGVERITLDGLDADALGVVLETAGYELDTAGVELRDMLTSETDGNPFFVSEVLRHLAETGVIRPGEVHRGVGIGDAAPSVPPNVREVIAQRVARLGGETRQVLGVAAVIGAAFPVATLGGAVGLDARSVLAALEPALQASIIEESTAGEYHFTHALVRRAVYESLTITERRGCHFDVAETLQRIQGDRAIAEVAHHVAAAVPVAEPARAVSVARRAAEAALSAVAYDDAARHLEAVLPVAPPDRARCELLLELADAHLRAGDVAAAQTRSLEASELAAQLEEPSLIVAAALVYGYADSRAVEHGDTAEQLLRDALPLADDRVTRVRIRATLGRSLAISGKIEEGQALGEEALADAREVEDAEALQTAFNAVLYASGTPDNIERQVDFAREFAEFARGRGDPETEGEALNRLISATISIGDLDEARILLERQRDVCRQSGQPLYRVIDLHAHALLAMGEGRFVEAEAMATEANEVALALSGSDAPGGYGVQLFSIRREQGRLDEARPIVESVARLGQEGATWGPALAVLYADLGMTDEAAGALRHLVGDGLRAVPRDALWLGSLSYLADTCVAVRDGDAAQVVYREFLPYRGLIVQVGMFLAAYGAVDRYLGALAALLGRGRDAETHFEAALRIDARAHMPVWLAHTQLAYGRFLTSRARGGDIEGATALLHAALETARDLGVAPVIAGASAALDRVAGTRPTLGADANGAGITDR
jgi:DNA-binding SARP family transcriptional activator/tetratricopeptide (TPR) repeat protein